MKSSIHKKILLLIFTFMIIYGSFSVVIAKETPVDNLEVVVKKQLIGRKIKPYEFIFVLEGTSELTKDVYEEIENDKYGLAKFSEIEFEDVGKYSYKIFELNTGDRKTRYDNKVYELEIDIKKLDGKLKRVVKLNGNTVDENKVVELKFISRTGKSIIRGNSKYK